MSFIQNFFTSRDNHADGNSYVGQQDRLWYNPVTNSIRVSDGVTPGGKTIDLDLGANATFDIATANTVITKTMYANAGTVYGELIVHGNISPATANTIGGIKPGPGVNISNQGVLTIDTANLPLSFGNFTATDNILSIVNVDQNMILETRGNAEIQMVGNIGFYKTFGSSPSGKYFSATSDGQVSIIVPAVDPTAGAVNIIGSTSGAAQSPINTGTMLQITGQNNLVSRLYNDSINNYSVWIGRRYNGTALAPTPVLAGESITRFGATTYTSANTFTPLGVGRFDFIALEDQTANAQGSAVVLSLMPVGSTVITTVATWTVANGMIGNVTGNLVGNTVNVSANVSAGNLVTTGKLSVTGNANIGNVGATSFVTAGSTINADISTGSVIAGNVFRYNVAQNNGTVTQLTDKSTTVTCNGRTGQITTAASSIAKGGAVTFTVTNSAITAVTDVPVVVLQGGATANSYAISVTRVQIGSFNITISNNGTGALADTLVINFAVIKVS